MQSESRRAVTSATSISVVDETAPCQQSINRRQMGKLSYPSIDRFFRNIHLSNSFGSKGGGGKDSSNWIFLKFSVSKHLFDS